MAKVAFVLYPNPADDVLNIETTLNIKSIEILNVQGQRVLTSTQKQINVSHLPAGTYMVRMEDVSSNVVVKKVVIK